MRWIPRIPNGWPLPFFACVGLIFWAGLALLIWGAM